MRGKVSLAVALLMLPEIAVRRLGGGVVSWIGRLVRRRPAVDARETGGDNG